MFDELYVGVARWREQWITRRGYKTKRVKGVWDATLVRESLRLKDDRRLTYFLDGPLLRRHELPHIFVFHAMFLTGNSFLMREAPSDFILVCVNRPGYFGSDPVSKDYSFESYAADMEQLADHLGVSNFMVAGHSSGGPCALACAAHLGPDRVAAVGLLSGDPEYADDTAPNKKLSSRILIGYVLPVLLDYVLCCLPLARHASKG